MLCDKCLHIRVKRSALRPCGPDWIAELAPPEETRLGRRSRGQISLEHNRAKRRERLTDGDTVQEEHQSYGQRHRT